VVVSANLFILKPKNSACALVNCKCFKAAGIFCEIGESTCQAEALLAR
jgi:hypothetical protein